MSAKPNERKITVPELIIPNVDDKGPPPPLVSPSSASAIARTLTKQSSQKINCLCSPTTHAGSFRCRHHRSSSLVRNSSSVGSALSDEGAGAGGPFSSKLSSAPELGGDSQSFGSQLSELADETTAGGASVGL